MSWYKNILEAAKRQWRPRKRTGPHLDYPRYKGPAALVTYMSNPAIIGNTYNIRQALNQFGFRWTEVLLDGSLLEGGQVAQVPGAWLRGMPLSMEEVQAITNLGVDTSSQGISLPVFDPQAAAQQQQEQMPQPVEEAVPVDPEAGMNIQPESGAQSDQANMDMVYKLQTATSFEDTENVIQEQLNKLMTIMSGTELTEEQAALKNDFIKFMGQGHNYSFNNMILTLIPNKVLVLYFLMYDAIYGLPFL